MTQTLEWKWQYGVPVMPALARTEADKLEIERLAKDYAAFQKLEQAVKEYVAVRKECVRDGGSDLISMTSVVNRITYILLSCAWLVPAWMLLKPCATCCCIPWSSATVCAVSGASCRRISSTTSRPRLASSSSRTVLVIGSPSFNAFPSPS